LTSDGTVLGAGTIQPRRRLAAVTVGGYLYAIGGLFRTSPGVATVEYASITDAGTLGAFRATASLPAPRYAACAVALEGAILVVGGEDGTRGFTDVLRARLDGGAIVAWDDIGRLPEARAYAGCAVAKGRLYVAGGGESAVAAFADTVYVVEVQPDGGARSTETTRLPAPLGMGALVAY
jgi:hypothetical protein